MTAIISDYSAVCHCADVATQRYPHDYKYFGLCGCLSLRRYNNTASQSWLRLTWIIQLFVSAQVWQHSVTHVAEVILEGLSLIKGRCTPIGRNAMFSDVQETLHSIKTIVPLQSPHLSAALEVQGRLLENYIKVGGYFKLNHARWIFQIGMRLVAILNHIKFGG